MAEIPKHLQRITGSRADRFVDEIVLCGVDVHVERMDTGDVWIGFYRPGSESRLHVDVLAVRKDDALVAAWWDGDPWPDVSHEGAKTWRGALGRLTDRTEEKT